MRKINWGAVAEVTDFERLTSGGYVCKIVKIIDNPAKEYLQVYMDVTEGEFKDYGSNGEKRNNNDWSYIRMYRSYKESAQGMFKGFLSALEKSNPGFKANDFDGDENKLVGLFLGVVLGYEEYEKKDGTLNIRTYVKTITTPEKIHNHDFKVPDLKKLAQKPQQQNNAPIPASSVVDDEELPF